MAEQKLTVEEAARRRTLVNQYASMLKNRSEKHRKEVGEEIHTFLSAIRYSGNNTVESRLTEALRDPAVIPSEWIKTHLRPAFGTMFHERDREIILHYADRLGDFPYTLTYTRRPLRSSVQSAYAHALCDMLRSFSMEWMPDVEPSRVLDGDIPEDMAAYLDDYRWRTAGYNEWQIAYALDAHHEPTETAVRRIITEENSMGVMTFALIRGVMRSHRDDLHTLMGQLLLAAKLQEGLRQAICENADCGTSEAMRTILQVISDHNLIRFSSVKRAVGTWLGIMSEETRDLERISEKSVRLLLECMDDPHKREEALASEDAMAIHISLMTEGFKDVDQAVVKVEQILEQGSRHQRLAAGYFAAQLENPAAANRLAKTAFSKYAAEGDTVAVWMPCFLDGASGALWNAFRHQRSVDYRLWFSSAAELREFSELAWSLYRGFSGKTKTYSPCVFPWYEVTISKAELADRICLLAAMSGEEDLIDAACPLVKEMDPNRRNTLFSVMLRTQKTPTQRRTVLEAIADRESYTRNAAAKLADGMNFTPDEYRTIEAYLRFKTPDIRKTVTSLLLKQSDSALQEAILRLLASPKEDVRFGALDMLAGLKEHTKRRSVFDAILPALIRRSQTEGIPSKEKTLLDTLVPGESLSQEGETPLCTYDDRYYPTEFDASYTETCAKAFADYFPDSKLPDLIREKSESAGFFSKLKGAMMGNTACKSAIQAALDLATLVKLIDLHKNDPYEDECGETALFGEFRYRLNAKGGGMPLPEVWNEWIHRAGITHSRLVRMMVLYYAYEKNTPFTENAAVYIRTVFGTGFEIGKQLPFDFRLRYLLDRLFLSVPREDLRLLASALTLWFLQCVPFEEVMLRAHTDKHLSPRLQRVHLLTHNQLSLLYNFLSCENTDGLSHVFPLAVASAERCMDAALSYSDQAEAPMTNSGIYYSPHRSGRVLQSEERDYYYRSVHTKLVDIRGYLYAAHRGLITERQLYEFMLRVETIKPSLETVSYAAAFTYERERQVAERHQYAHRWMEQRIHELIGEKDLTKPLAKEDADLLAYAAQVYEVLIPRVIEAELRRGDSPSAYTDGIPGICRLYGAEYFTDILRSLGSDTLDRTAYYGWSAAKDRRSSLSYLLSVCIPLDTDTAETLAQALDGKKIPKKRLIEAALYSPEWIPLVGEYLGIEAFASVCYYFMAHMNEKFDDKKRAVIARYTPLSEEELNLGAFDVAWFKSAIAAIGESDFNLVYDAAKYIADGAKHARARKYADAALGRFTVEDTEKTISDKRNKDLLMAYSLIPLEGEDDICRRYLYIQRFRKESKQFGSQRIVSEGKAVEMALKNLATNAGYADSMRLTLRMETKVIDDSRTLLEPQSVEDVILRLTLDENGKADIRAEKDGKELKSIPSRIKKHETVIALTELKKTLTEQYRRTRRMLEEAMEDGTVFTHGELSALAAHPVVYPMLKNLVLTDGISSGFLASEGLTDAQGKVISMNPQAELRIAHPYDLYAHGCWRDFQKYLYDNRITQPYRQVFRELYIPTPEEAETYHSLRYAGNQIQPAKTVATLKSRRWVADVEDGLQKVYYKENVVAQIYAMADWFSPADIEAPTLEWVCFSDRKTGKELKLSDIPPILFSEVMRDVDLAVSVAHAGGVDPETSHSTMEMRAAILSFILPLFKLSNVRVEGRHALIEGKLADYTVHLGSGVVHQQGGAMIPVLPVHSQHRGRIFLPFVDEDPKTAEIISKVLLFAEDTKIKDPGILSEIHR